MGKSTIFSGSQWQLADHLDDLPKKKQKTIQPGEHVHDKHDGFSKWHFSLCNIPGQKIPENPLK